MTRRLDLADPDTLEFRARVLRRQRAGDAWEIVLEETYFYPESGGQPHDLGTLSGVPVVAVRLEGDEVIHVTTDSPPGEVVEGRIDGERRLDQRCQHTGQHILSRAFLDVAGAPTVSSRLGGAACTIDLPIDEPDPALLDRVERAAQAIVDADVPVRFHFFERGATIPFDLRRKPGDHDTIRVIEIEGYDATPCGGTHCRRSGAVGLVKIVAGERYKKGLSRVTFLCGARAVEDYRRKHREVRELVRSLMTPEGDLAAEVDRLRERIDESERQAKRMWREIVASRASRLRESASGTRNRRIVRHVADDLPPEHAAALARAIVGTGGIIAVVACRGEPATVAVAASGGMAPGLGKILAGVLEQLGGRGGGGDTFASGALPADSLERCLDLLIDRLAPPDAGDPGVPGTTD